MPTRALNGNDSCIDYSYIYTHKYSRTKLSLLFIYMSCRDGRNFLSNDSVVEVCKYLACLIIAAPLEHNESQTALQHTRASGTARHANSGKTARGWNEAAGVKQASLESVDHFVAHSRPLPPLRLSESDCTHCRLSRSWLYPDSHHPRRVLHHDSAHHPQPIANVVNGCKRTPVYFQ